MIQLRILSACANTDRNRNEPDTPVISSLVHFQLNFDCGKHYYRGFKFISITKWRINYFYWLAISKHGKSGFHWIDLIISEKIRIHYACALFNKWFESVALSPIRPLWFRFPNSITEWNIERTSQMKKNRAIIELVFDSGCHSINSNCEPHATYA